VQLGCADRKEVILVTGGSGFVGQHVQASSSSSSSGNCGSGFVGQHVVRLLQERADNVREIRVFDTRPYRNKLGKLHQLHRVLQSYPRTPR